MALIYDLDELSHSGLDAMQTTQRDWSSYLVHFTSRVAMTSLKKALKQKQAINVDVVSSMLKESDEASLGQFKKILKDRTIRASAFDERNGSTRLVCLSECSLPGVFNLSCRYGRFGFVFKKRDILQMNGRPCVYVDAETYKAIKRPNKRDKLSEKLWGLANEYRPAGIKKCGEVLQDFTVEREWRTRHDVPLDYLCGLLCPSLEYHGEIMRELEQLKMSKLNLPIFPLDMLYKWGV